MPITETQNALTNGLYTARDFIRPGEEPEYAKTLQSVFAEIEPVGTIEETFAAEIVGATWRLRRCRLVEQSFSLNALDPMVDEDLEKQQKSVDRARAQSHNILRRSIAEVRKMQTDRVGREQAAESLRKAQIEMMHSLIEEMAEDEDPEDEASVEIPFCNPVGQISDLPTKIPFCKSPEALPGSAPTPRGAPCPCGSGRKYKRCCGQGAPPVLHEAA
jgi:hypothetical protein